MSLSGLAQSKCDITKMLKNSLARLWEEIEFSKFGAVIVGSQ
jgi:hypothetical protein